MPTTRRRLLDHPSALMSRRASDLSYPLNMDVTGKGPDPQLRFGRTVREARIQRGWTQDQLAAAAEVSVPTIERWESGRTKTPDPENARKVFHALGLDPRRIPVVLGYITAEEMGLPAEQPRVRNRTTEEILSILEDASVPAAVKSEVLSFLRFRVQDQPPLAG